jgi:hypothetical protein
LLSSGAPSPRGSKAAEAEIEALHQVEAAVQKRLRRLSEEGASELEMANALAMAGPPIDGLELDADEDADAGVAAKEDGQGKGAAPEAVV